MTNLDKLLLLVDEEIENHSISHLGLKWCGLSQAEISERLGVSRDTVKRTLRTEQILSFVRVIDGNRRTLLCRGGVKTTAEYRAVRDQRIMKAEFLKHTKSSTVPPKAYGCLRELCLTWPEKERLAIFRHTMRPANWRAFMACYKFDAGMHPDKYPGHNPGRFYKYPNIYPLVDGREVAHQCYIDHLQDTGKAPH